MTRDLQSVQKSKIQFSISSDLAARINVNKDKLALVHALYDRHGICTDDMQNDSRHLDEQECRESLVALHI